MKTNFFILAILWIAAISLSAQSSPLVLVSSTGEMSYKGSSKKNLEVGPGSLLSLKGVIRLKERSSAIVLCNEGFNLLATGKNELSKICGGSDSKRSLGIDGAFSQYILSSLNIVFLMDGWGVKDQDGWGQKDQDGWAIMEQDTSASGTVKRADWGVKDQDGWGQKDQDGWGQKDQDGWGQKDQDGWGQKDQDGWGQKDQDGWGGRGNKIHLIMPVGKISKKSIRFSWSKPAGVSSYTLRILDAENMVVDSILTTDTFAILDLSKKSLVIGQRYSWQVSAGDASVASNTLQFEAMAGDEKKAIQSKFSKSKIYYKLDPVAKLLMEATALEQDQMFYMASETYAKARKLDANNNLVKMMHGAFWIRGSLPVMAKTAVLK